MDNDIPIYIMTDQPVSCPRCYRRADIIEEQLVEGVSRQLCKCSDAHCNFLFIEEQDDYFTLEYWMNEKRE
jgi:hypothetical protein